MLLSGAEIATTLLDLKVQKGFLLNFLFVLHLYLVGGLVPVLHLVGNEVFDAGFIHQIENLLVRAHVFGVKILSNSTYEKFAVLGNHRDRLT